MNKKEVQKRAKFIDDFSCAVAGSSSEKECTSIYTEYFKYKKYVFKPALKNAGFDLMETLTPEQTINVQTLLRMPTNKL